MQRQPAAYGAETYRRIGIGIIVLTFAALCAASLIPNPAVV